MVFAHGRRHREMVRQTPLGLSGKAISLECLTGDDLDDQVPEAEFTIVDRLGDLLDFFFIPKARRASGSIDK